VALILTSKRGVLLWSFGSVFLTYIICSDRQLGKLVKIFIGIFVVASILQIVSESLPELNYLIGRFETLGEDSESRERLAMWSLGLRSFTEKPIFGNGFWSYRTIYYENLGQIMHRYTERYQRLDAHNVYIQVLCETGITGFVIYCTSIICTLKKTIDIIKHSHIADTPYLKTGIMLSLCFQLFFLLYSLSGNCLYDVVFYFYAISIAFVLSINYKLKKSKGGSGEGLVIDASRPE